MATPTSQLLSRTLYDTDGITTVWDFSFSGGYLDPAHVRAYVETPAGARTDIVVTESMLIGEFQLQITPALASGNELVIYRDTPKDLPLVDFTDEAGLSEVSLDTNAKQAVFIAAEGADLVNTSNVGAALTAAALAAEAAEAAAVAASAANSAAVSAENAALSAETSASDAANVVVNLTATTGAATVGADDDAAGSLFTTVQGGFSWVATKFAALASSVGSTLIGFLPAGAGAVPTTVQAKLRDSLVSIKDFGGVCDGVTNDAAALVAALTSGRPVSIPGACFLSLDTAQAQVVVYKLNLLRFEQLTVVYLPAGEIAVAGFVEVNNASAVNIDLRGVDLPQTTATAVTNLGGASNNHSIQYTLSNADNCAVGDYVIVSGSVGSGLHRVVEGCFKVTAKSGSGITVKHTLFGSWPSFTFTSAAVRPVKTIIRWPADNMGLRVYGCSFRALRNVVLAGAFNITTAAPFDGAGDGLQVGSVSNTFDTGLNESEQTNSGSIWCARVGIVEFQGNGVQVIGGKFYGALVSSCSNAWRGFQAASAGSCTAKFSSAVGNGASGYEAEGVGWMNADKSVAAGNKEQGYYCIGSGAVAALDAHAICNGSAGLDARNFGNIQADGAYTSANSLQGVSSAGGDVLFGAGAISTGNVGADVLIGEGGVVNAAGASNLGSVVTVDTDSGSMLVDIDGDLRWPSAEVLENATHQERRAITGVGDIGISLGLTGALVARYTFKADGTFHPAADGSQSLGRLANRWGTVFSNRFSPGAGTVIWTSGAGSPEGSLSANVGSLYTNTTGGPATTLYVKESGTGNTGWIAK